MYDPGVNWTMREVGEGKGEREPLARERVHHLTQFN